MNSGEGEMAKQSKVLKIMAVLAVLLFLISGFLAFTYVSQTSVHSTSSSSTNALKSTKEHANSNIVEVKGSAQMDADIYHTTSFNIKWNSLGPYNIENFSKGMPGFYGSGKVNAFAIERSNPEIMYVGAGVQAIEGPYSDAGIFKTVNGGKTWFPIDNGILDPQISSIVLDQTNISILLASAWSDPTSLSPMGVFRSNDGGQNWSLVLSVPTSGLFFMNGSIYASTSQGVFVSQDWGLTWSLLKGTSTWATFITGLDGNIYVGLWNGTELIYQKNTSLWYYSYPTNLTQPFLRVMDIAVNPWNPNEQYLVDWRGYQSPDLFYTANNGRSWTKVENLSYTAAQEVAYGNNSSTIYVGADGALYVSFNNGNTFSELPLYVDVRFIDVEPNGIYVGSDQGMYFSNNGGNSWVSSTGDLHSSLLTDVSVSNGTIITAVQDYSPIISYDSGKTWDSLSYSPFAGSEDGMVAINPTNSSYVYTFTGGVQLMVSNDGGRSFFYPQGAPNVANSFWSNNAVAFDPNDSKNVYLATKLGVYFSSNYGLSWKKEPWPFTNVSSIAISPQNNKTIFLGINYGNGSGLIYFTNDNGTTWQPSSLKGGTPQSIVIDPINSSIILVSNPYYYSYYYPNGSFAGYGAVIYKSIDGGANFYEVDIKMPNVLPWFYTPFGSQLLFVPNTDVVLFASGEGLYISYDAGSDWSVINGNATPFAFTGISLSNGNVYVSTQGEGVIYAPLGSILPHKVTFTESGLPPNTKWSVVLDGMTESSTTYNISFDLPNGMYAYSITTVNNKYAPTQPTGSINVNGTNLNISISFHLVTYEIMFAENGLPQGTPWYVTLNGIRHNSTTNTIEFTEPNGSYAYAIETPISDGTGIQYVLSQSKGTLTVNGADININVSYTKQYYLTIIASPSNGGTVSPSSGWYNAGSSVTIEAISNSNFEFVSWSGTGNGSYSGTNNPVSIKINGPITEKANFTELYEITFTETGLLPGTIWYVNLSNGQSYNTTSNSIEIQIPNGSYSYMIATTNKEYSAQGGSLIVNGANLEISIKFNLVTYAITFTESGLPSGYWYVNITGQPSSGPIPSSQTSYSVSLPNGSYSYTISTGNKEYKPSYTGSFTVNGANVNIGITFNLVTYKITFTESGLPSGTTWSVTLNNITKTSTSGAIIFNEPNGSYLYIISGISGYRANKYSGTINVMGNPVSNSITWTVITYPITIIESGIPNGTSWSATLTGTTFNGKYINVTLSSTTNTITFNEPNGTYSYIIHLPSGYQSNNAKGSVNVSGNSAIVTIKAQQTMNYLLIGIIAVVIVIAIVIVVILLRKRKNKQGVKELKEPPKQN